jgi:hypothetical protein
MMKSNLLKNIIKKVISETPVDYGDYEERMDPRIQQSIEDPEGIYAKNRGFKGGKSDVERLAGTRFKEIVDYVKNYFGQRRNVTDPRVQSEIIRQQMQAVSQVMSIEPRHRERLRDLAVEIAAKEEGWMRPSLTLQQLIDEGIVSKKKGSQGGVVYELRFINILTFLGEQRIDPNIFQMKPKENKKLPLPPNFSFDIDELTPEEQKQLEIEKRNVINALIQGSGKRGQFAYQLYKNRLDDIDPRLYPLYNQIMAANDLMYFTNQSLIEMLGGNAAGSAGKLPKAQSNDDEEEEEDEQSGEKNDNETYFANGLIFPILLHELSKIFDIIPAREQWRGMDPEMATQVISQTDTMLNEPMNFRVGAELVKKIRSLFPDELLLDPESKIFLPYFKRRLYGVPAEEFLKEIISNVISENPKDQEKAKRKFSEILSLAKKDYNRFEGEESDEDEDYDEDMLDQY